MRKLLGALIVAAAAFTLAAAGVEDLFKADAEFWQKDAAALAEGFGGKFIQLAKGSNQFRHYGEGLTFAGNNVPEAIITVEDGKIALVELYLYTKGDSKDKLSQRDYNAKVKELLNRFAAEFPGVDFLHLVRNLGRSSVICNVYSTPGVDAALRYNTDAERNGCIAALFAPPGKLPRNLDFSARKVAPAELVKRVSRTEDGDVMITVPMVDQGDKGFCLPASVCRVLRYYGSPVDQNTIATMLSSDAEKGTNLVDAMKLLRKGANKINASTREVLDGESLISKKSCAKLVKDYNKLANKLNRDRERSDRIAKIELDGEKIPKIDPECLMAARKNDRAVKKFEEVVRKSIDRGQVLCWNLVMFKPNKEGKLAAGIPAGHTRIICGYNSQKGEVLYTDSWGAPGELGRMPLADAWGLTLSIFTIEPR